MEIKELVSYYINESSEIIEVTFRLTIDGDDEIRTDQIQIGDVKTFGYNFDNFTESKLIEMYNEEDDDEDDDFFGNFFGDDDLNDMDQDEIKSFLNEYYLIFPDRLPNPEFF